MLTKARKQEIVKNTEKLLEKQKVLILSTFKGIPVSKLSLFRRELRKIGGEFKVIRKTLLQRALKEKNINLDALGMAGEIGTIFGYENEVDPAKSAVKFGKENKTFQILAGILGESVMKGEEIIALAKLPTREQLLGKLVGVLQSPIAGFQGVLAGNIRGFAQVLNQIAATKK